MTERRALETPRGRGYTVIVEQLDDEHSLVYVPEDRTILCIEDIDFFATGVRCWQPDGPGSWVPVPVQRCDTGELQLPSLCDVVSNDDVERWIASTGEAVDDLIQQHARTIVDMVYDAAEVAASLIADGRRTVEDYAPDLERAEAYEVYAYVNAAGEVMVGAWGPSPRAVFDPAATFDLPAVEVEFPAE